LACFIERGSIDEGSPASGAERFGVERFRLVQAAGADGDAGNFMEGFVAEAALIGENKVDQAANYPSHGAHRARGQVRF
jgi:hypothetical protein